MVEIFIILSFFEISKANSHTVFLVYVNRNRRKLNKTTVTAIRLAVKSDAMEKTNLRCSFTGQLKIYHAAKGRTYVSHDDFMIIEINDRVAVHRARAGTDYASPCPCENVSHAICHVTMISVYPIATFTRYFCRLAYMLICYAFTFYCHFLSSVFTSSFFMSDSAKQSIRRHF